MGPPSCLDPTCYGRSCLGRAPLPCPPPPHAPPEHMARRWGPWCPFYPCPPLLPDWLWPFILGLSDGVCAELAWLFSSVGCCHRGGRGCCRLSCCWGPGLLARRRPPRGLTRADRGTGRCLPGARAGLGLLGDALCSSGGPGSQIGEPGLCGSSIRPSDRQVFRRVLL
uniref:Uncharacterized protein n=1 Tax=Felis catus TaxID=9685 RepID=A0ABI7YA27_FELCA